MVRRVRSALAGGLGWGLGMGLALGVTGALNGSLRPLAKGAMKGSLALYDKVTEVAAEAREVAADLYHEAREERVVEQAAREGTARTRGEGSEVLLIPREL